MIEMKTETMNNGNDVMIFSVKILPNGTSELKRAPIAGNIEIMIINAKTIEKVTHSDFI